jgi:[glutamine synthetase] adenylyltransferase / [glutamine synthetase]-adenylyl-L-tyrosine phosphorylase
MDDTLKMLAEKAEEKAEAFRQAAEDAKALPAEDPAVEEALGRVFAFSDFVFKACIRNPKLLADLIESGDLKRKFHKDEYPSRLESALEDLPMIPESDTSAAAVRLLTSSLQHLLRRFRTHEMVRIAWRDLTGWADLNEIMTDLSALADACIHQAASRLYTLERIRFGMPTDAEGTPQDLVIIAMGKLGAWELNFSSDVDLIFAYPETGKTVGGEKTISNDEFFTRMARGVMHLIGANTSDGIVFRVDARLRPFGENGPLVMCFDSMEEYYQYHGREWERYAWIKARVISGNKEEGACLMERLRPFVYRRYLDFSTFESLRDMKRMVAAEVRRKGMDRNIKLGPGGIREIEFFGQIFQLIRGGVSPILQQQQIQKVLRLLSRENIVPQIVCDELAGAYLFLRKTENRLQEFSDEQTHELPQDDVKRSLLAASMGFAGWDAFSAQLAAHTQKVHEHFNNLLQTKDGRETENENHLRLAGIWQSLETTGQHIDILTEAGFHAPKDILGILRDLENDPETQKLSSEGRKRLDTLVPKVLEASAGSENPAMVLNRLVHLIKNIERRTTYLSLLLEHATVLDHLVRLAGESPWIISFVAKHPVLMDELIGPQTIYQAPDRSELKRELAQRLERLPHEDLEYQMEALRIFKQASILRVAAADVDGSLPLMKVSDHLTYIAETVLETVLDLSWEHLIDKHGKPDCHLNGLTLDKGFAVIAYGKLGGFELGYSSDLDLVFLHSGAMGQTNGGRPIDNSLFFSRLGQRVIHILNTHTSAGILYETDMRLRPSGSSGLLVSHIEAFGEYQKNQAWSWEHQALIRARSVCGDASVAGRFEEIRSEVLSRSRDPQVLRREVSGMRKRLRQENASRDPKIFDLSQGEGGIVDIEFLVQYLVLKNANTHRELLKWTDNVRLLDTLWATQIIDQETEAILRNAYLTYRLAGHRLSLQEKSPLVEKTEFSDLRNQVSDLWHAYIGPA